MSVALGELEPRLVWDHFLALTRIPRPSKHEGEARDHVLAWASERGFATDVDAEGNAVARVPASPGRDGAPTIVLQAHLDMVCEREPGSPNDPREGRIAVVRDGDWIVADGTTLGADNGIGVAGALAVAEDPQAVHGPLELLFTVSEEQGLDGAKALAPELVTGRMLLNLDGTSDGALTVGCAGSTHAFTRLPLERSAVPPGYVTLDVRLSGARGGHSGGDIAKGRVNAIKALARVLSRGFAAAPFQLVSLDGGVSRNAIPRDARALIAAPSDAEALVRSAAATALDAIREQYAGTDDGVVLSVETAEPAATAADGVTTRRALDLLEALPTGVVAMSPALPGAVETSTSVTVAETSGHVLTLASMTRSANAPALEEVVERIRSLGRLAGADVEAVRSYPPWRPDLSSSLLTRARETFTRSLGSEPKLEVVHGGLECAVIGGKLPGIEMISIGPEVQNPHAPGERLSVPATERFYVLLRALLDDLSAPYPR
jgi:dipeptidase D